MSVKYKNPDKTLFEIHNMATIGCLEMLMQDIENSKKTNITYIEMENFTKNEVYEQMEKTLSNSDETSQLSVLDMVYENLPNDRINIAMPSTEMLDNIENIINDISTETYN